MNNPLQNYKNLLNKRLSFFKSIKEVALITAKQVELVCKEIGFAMLNDRL